MAFMPLNMRIDENDHLQSIVDDSIANKVMYVHNMCLLMNIIILSLWLLCSCVHTSLDICQNTINTILQ